VASARQTALGALLASGLVALNVAWVASALGPPPHRPREVPELDHRRYIAMAGALPGQATSSLAREAPFAYRVLAPFLVQLATRAGVDLHLAFWVLTVLSATLFLFVLFRHLLLLGFATGSAALGTTLAGLMPGAVRWYAYQYWMPDPLCLLLVALGVHLVVARRHAALACVALAGLLTRESWLLVVVYALLRWRRLEGVATAARGGLAVFGPALAAFVAVRVGLSAATGPSLVDAAQEMLAFRARHLFDNQLYFATLGTFGVLVPLLLARVGHAKGWLRDHAEDAGVVATVYASLAFANNTDRLLVYSLPVLMPAALGASAGLATALRVPRSAFAAVVLGLQAFVFWRTPFHGVAGLSVYQPVQWAVVMALVAFWALCVLAPRLLRAQP
jgi:hypothetical protein